MNFSNSYAKLGAAFYQRVLPTPVARPELLLWNTRLATKLGLSQSLNTNAALQAQIFSGNELPEGSDPIALAYSGHQFGQLNPQLGDGRAHLIGEIISPDSTRYDIQLKGSGQTPFSRRGDGRCALGPALREYIMSEAMYYLSVPTTRCLSVVSTGESIYRETKKPGAVVTRIASSHIRVGTFQYFAIRNDICSLQTLLDYSIHRHFPMIEQSSAANTAEISSTGHNTAKNTATTKKAIQFISAVMEKQVELVVAWMRVGFIHGVMNTDNTAISGETIDFGPCAMMGAYHPGTVYSSIDSHGRYAFGNQPSIALWNVTRLAECLLPLIDSNEQQAITAVQTLLNEFSTQFESAYFTMLSNKLGMATTTAEHRPLIEKLLEIMQNKSLDYTMTFNQLTCSLDDEKLAIELIHQLGDWYHNWRKVLEDSNDNIDLSKQLMKKNNPCVIPRNHHMEAVLSACEANANIQAADDFLEVLRSPYTELPNTINYQDLPADRDSHYRTYCGT